MEEIAEWLESGQDYAQGVALYDVHGRSAVVRRTLAYGETEFTQARLLKELQALVTSDVTTNVPAGQPGVRVNVSVKTANDEKSIIRDKKTSTAVDPQRRDWFAERNHLHAQLGLVATDEERRVMALRILALGDCISQSYAAEASLSQQASGPAPDHKWAGLADVGEIRRLLANLRPQRSKLKNRPDRAADLATVEADIHLLETKLKP